MNPTYSTPQDPYERDRAKYPYLSGDLFTNANGDEITVIDIREGVAYCVKKYVSGEFKHIRLQDWRILTGGEWQQNMHYVQREIDQASNGIYAPRKLQDGTWIGLCRLVATTAICIGYDDQVMYETRYCFSNNSILSGWHTAVYWLAQITSKEDLPIGNCAFRGRLGTRPIISDDKTISYYEALETFKYQPEIQGMNLHEYASYAMAEVLTSNMQKNRAA